MNGWGREEGEGLTSVADGLATTDNRAYSNIKVEKWVSKAYIPADPTDRRGHHGPDGMKEAHC